MSDDEEEPKVRQLPRREAQAKQAILAIGLVFFLGIAIGFVLAKAF